MEARARLAHVDRAEEVLAPPCAGRGRRRARRWRVPGAARGTSRRSTPRARARPVMRAVTSSSGSVGEARPGRGRRRRARPRTRPSAARSRRPRSRPSSPRASRSRVGNAYASPARSPKRSISRFRIAKAEKSETCCAVIEVTSASHGSGTSGGRKPRRRSSSGASTRVALGEGAEPVEVEARAEVALESGPDRVVERVDVHAVRRRLDAHLRPVDDPVEPTVEPQVREVDPEGPVALRGEVEAVRLRQRQHGHARR